VVHLKDFSLLYTVIQSADVLKAIETAIPATAIEQAIALDTSLRGTQTLVTSTIGSLFGNCDESVVERFNERCAEKLN
jgi:hypothetical protein